MAQAAPVATKLQAFWNSPAGPKTSECLVCLCLCARAGCRIAVRAAHLRDRRRPSPPTAAHVPQPYRPIYLLVHFWAPTFKWGITFANIADLQRPPEKVSYAQQSGA